MDPVDLPVTAGMMMPLKDRSHSARRFQRPADFRRVLDAGETWAPVNTGLPPAALKTENLSILRDQETDWRKRAVIAAEIIKQNL